MAGALGDADTPTISDFDGGDVSEDEAPGDASGTAAADAGQAGNQSQQDEKLEESAPTPEVEQKLGGRRGGGGGSGRGRGRGGAAGGSGKQGRGCDRDGGSAAAATKTHRASSAQNGTKGGRPVKHQKGQSRQCQGCFKSYPHGEFPAGSIYCWEDKRALNNLHNAALAQDELPWYKEQVEDPLKRKKLLIGYHKMCPAVPDGGRRKGFYFAKYREVERAESGVLWDDVAEMMSEIAFVDWRAKPK